MSEVARQHEERLAEIEDLAGRLSLRQATPREAEETVNALLELVALVRVREQEAAEAVSSKVGPIARRYGWIDKDEADALRRVAAELRDALEGVGWRDAGGMCWCDRAQEETGLPHAAKCRRARAALGEES